MHAILRLASVSTLALVTVGYGQHSSSEKLPSPTPVAGVRDVMKGIVEPLTRTVFASVGTVITEEGTKEIAPRSDEEWDAVRSAAMGLAETGNLLMSESRAKGKDADWMTMSQMLVARSVDAASAAKAKNADQLLIAGGDLFEVCESCHTQYMAFDTWEQWRESMRTPCWMPLRGVCR